MNRHQEVAAAEENLRGLTAQLLIDLDNQALGADPPYIVRDRRAAIARAEAQLQIACENLHDWLTR